MGGLLKLAERLPECVERGHLSRDPATERAAYWEAMGALSAVREKLTALVDKDAMRSKTAIAMRSAEQAQASLESLIRTTPQPADGSSSTPSPPRTPPSTT